MGKLCENINKVIVANGGQAVVGSKADCFRGLISTLEGITVPASCRTVGEVFEYWANLEQGAAKVTISPKDSSDQPITGATVVLKKGSEIGQGEEVVVGQDGKFQCTQGVYNFSIAKEGYVTKTGTFEVTASHVTTGSLTVSVTLQTAPSQE